MEKQLLLETLRKTLSDHRLSRGEKKTVKEFVGHYFKSQHDLAVLRSEAFELAKAELISPESIEVLGWLEDVVKLLIPQNEQRRECSSEVLFSSQDNCVNRIRNLIGMADHTIDICVFTITDNRISEEIEEAAGRNVKVRIISDDDKANDPGSDIYRLIRRGIPVRTDRDPNHMHHKFAIFDNNKLLNGSYNWTRSAATENEENYVISDEPKLVASFREHFERLWDQFNR